MSSPQPPKGECAGESLLLCFNAVDQPGYTPGYWGHPPKKLAGELKGALSLHIIEKILLE